MIRYVATIAVALFLTPSWLCAQSTEFKVTNASASVYKSPSTGSPVIGQAARGAVLEVTRELGSWVKVVWPAAPDRTGYVHVTMGSIAQRTVPGPNRVTPAASSRPPVTIPPPPPTATATTVAARTEHVDAGDSAALTRTVYVSTPTHIVGVGGRMGGLMGGPSLGFGATTRAWSSKNVGMQFDMSRYTLADAAGRRTSNQFTPSVLYSLPGKLTDYFWLRPYVGSGPTLQRESVNATPAGAGNSVSTNRFGFQAFGGGEVTFASVPRFALSADLGYHWLPTTALPGFDLGGLGLSVSGHWYVK